MAGGRHSTWLRVGRRPKAGGGRASRSWSRPFQGRLSPNEVDLRSTSIDFANFANFLQDFAKSGLGRLRVDLGASESKGSEVLNFFQKVLELFKSFRTFSERFNSKGVSASPWPLRGLGWARPKKS